MDLKDFLEYPLPKIEVNLNEISINMRYKTDGFINIKNVGQGDLFGEIICNTKCLALDRTSFRSNDINIFYSVEPYIYCSGDIVESELIIISNGGEISVPIFINITKFDYLKCGIIKVYEIIDFYNYYLKNYVEAIRIFYSYEFILWLKTIEFKHIKIVEEILKDANKQRAIDNFFILAKIKEKAYIDIQQKIFKYKYFISDKNKEIIGIIPIKLIGTGYFEETITLEDSQDFIHIAKNKITNRDFDENGIYNLEFKIIKENIKNFFERRKILFNNFNKNVIIELNRKNFIDILLEKQYFYYIDKGTLKIFNNTEEDIIIEILPKDTFIYFEAKKYIVGKYMEIDFNIKFSTFLRAQMDFTKTPNIKSDILIKVISDDNIFNIQKEIYIGSNLI